MKKKNLNKFALLWYSHPRIAIALMLIGLNLGIILLFTGVLSIIRGVGFFDELAFVFAFTVSADGVYDIISSNVDVWCFIIKIVLAVIQMLVFAGALIGFTTNILQSTIDKRLNNAGKLNLANHYVFLNWSKIGANIIYDLSFCGGEKNIVILCDDDRDAVMNSIHNVFTENKRSLKGMNIFIKNGDSNSIKHLSDISISKASYIGILLAEINNNETQKISPNDLYALKSLLSIMNVNSDANIVVEVESDVTVNKIEKLINCLDEKLAKRIVAFSHDSVIGHVLGKVLINRTYSELYHHLLSYDGCEFYGLEPNDVETALYKYNNCIPIVNYDDDDEIDENGEKQAEHLYVISSEGDAFGERLQPKSFVKDLIYCDNVKREGFTLFVVSDKEDSQFVIKEIEQYNKTFGVKIKHINFSYNDNIEDIKESIRATDGIKKILLFSGTELNGDNQDADVFLMAMALKMDGTIKDVEIFAEITNIANLNALSNMGVASVIITSQIISLFLVQLLTHTGSKKFFRDLISSNNEEGTDALDLDIVKAKDLLVFSDKNLTFSCKSEFVQSFYIASNKNKMCIGIKRANQNKPIEFLCDNMDEQIDLIVYPEDELILISY